MSSGALYIAPATPGSVSVYGWLPGKRRPRASGGHRAAAPPGSSVYYACHAKRKRGGSVYSACQAKGSRGPSGGHRAAAPPGSSVYRKLKCGGSVYCVCQAKGSRGPAAATAPHLLQKALCTAPATQKGSGEALCTAPARQKAAAGQRRPPRRSSARKLCVLRLPRKSGGHRAAAPPGSYLYSQ